MTGTADKKLNQAPNMTWAQRNDKLYITVAVQDAKDDGLAMDWEDAKRLKFVVTNKNNDTWAVDLELFGEITQEGSKKSITGRQIEMVLMKVNEDAYWPQLTATKQKLSTLKTNFELWKDEDDSEDEGSAAGGKQDDMADLMSRMQGMGGDMGDMGDMGMGEEDEEDSDDGDMPDLESAEA